MQFKKNILLTRKLSGRQIEYARILGLEPVVKPALEFQFPSYWDKVLKVITNHPKASWVFTSSNGVKALKQLMKAGLQVRPEIAIYAVGAKTQEALNSLGLEAKIPHIQDGFHLAEQIIEEQGENSEVLYFHGNLSRDEMTDKLTQENIKVTDVEVYETIIHPVEMPPIQVEAVLFYSPSAVEGFAQGQGFDEDLPPLFAIGPTTTEALAERTDQKIITSKKPDAQIMLRTVSDYMLNRKATKS